MPSLTADPRARGHVLKRPIATIPVECVCAVDRAKIKITPAVAIEVAQRHAGAFPEIVVLHPQPVIERIREVDPGLWTAEQRETGIALGRNREPGDASSGDGLPFQSSSPSAPAKLQENNQSGSKSGFDPSPRARA